MKMSFQNCGTLLLPFLCAAWLLDLSQARSQGRPTETSVAAKPANSNTEGKNPIKATPESLADAKKFFGYDCAMCHGATGDGKGDLAKSMDLKMNDWRDSSKLSALSDVEILDLIVKGKGRMVGEGDRYPTEVVWELVNYVRSLDKKETAVAPKTGSS
jgi:mono/diheme cytochrome c family protein